MVTEREVRAVLGLGAAGRTGPDRTVEEQFPYLVVELAAGIAARAGMTLRSHWNVWDREVLEGGRVRYPG